MAQRAIRQCLGHLHGDRVWFLSRGTAGAPDSERVVVVRLLASKQIVHHIPLKQVQLRLVAEEAGLVDREVFEQERQFLFPVPADEQAVVAVKGIQLAFLHAPVQSVLEERSAPVVEVHAALLIHERLQQLQFRFAECCGFAWIHVG